MKKVARLAALFGASQTVAGIAIAHPAAQTHRIADGYTIYYHAGCP